MGGILPVAGLGLVPIVFLARGRTVGLESE